MYRADPAAWRQCPQDPCGRRAGGQSTLVDHHALAVERGRLDWQGAQRLHDRRDSVSPLTPLAAEHPHAIALAPADEAISVVLHLVGPARTVRHGARRGW